MGATSHQQPLSLHLQGTRDKQPSPSRSNNNSNNMKPAPIDLHVSPTSRNRSKSFSTKSFYNKCRDKVSNIIKASDEPTWKVAVSPDEETGESMQIVMLENDKDRAGSATSASSEEEEGGRMNVITAAGGEKKSKLGGFFKGKKGGGDNKNNSDQNGEHNDKSNGDGNTNENSDKGSSNNNGTPNGFGPPTDFSPERTSFAQQSTLPLHPGDITSAPTSHPSWTPATGNNFNVRVGPNYQKTGKKEPSLENLYEVYCVRYFRSPCRTVHGATRIMPLPETTSRDGEAQDEGQSQHTEGSSHPELTGKTPHVLVVHFMLPYEPPNMFKQKDDGPGGECVYYLRPSQRFLDEVSGKIPMTPATRLFVRWCNECQHNVEMRSRFKCMALVRDLEKHNFGLLKSYNGKPVLITESGRVCSGAHGDVRYLEMTANVHQWAFVAKKGFVSIIPKFKNMQMEVGFTIEGRGDHELPECMLGSTILSYINEETGPMITPEMQEPVHEHQS